MAVDEGEHKLNMWGKNVSLFVCLLLETKPHQDVLREEKIKIVPIAEVKGVQGNWNRVALCFM